MLSRLSISLRLLLLILVPVAALLIVAMSSLASIQAGSVAASRFADEIGAVASVERLNRDIAVEVFEPLAEYEAGRLSAVAAADRLMEARRSAEARLLPLQRQLEGLIVGPEILSRIAELAPVAQIEQLVDTLRTVDAAAPGEAASLAPRMNSLRSLLEGLGGVAATLQENAERTRELSLERDQQFMIVNATIGVIGLVLALLMGYYIARSITQPVQQMTGVVERVGQGDYSSRSELSGFDEIAQLGRALDQLLNDRVATLARTEKDNEQLNDSVIQLLRTVSRLSRRDLTVRVPVTEDVTGPVADAINQLTTETNRVLVEVSRIAGDVANAAELVNRKATFVNELADAQGTQAATTSQELDSAATRLAEISEIANQCQNLSSRTTEMTESASNSVNSTLEGMTSIREVIQETGKRIKHLGERSQEISGVVDIINQITERTTVLALNASMQAAAAGEAGRGFAVVADEVQRLAENSRNATGQIASLVKSIQVETNETISTMDQTIAKVIEGSRLAEGAGRQMTDTRQSTDELVSSVLRIAASSREQADLSQALRERAEQMIEQTSQTRKEMEEQLQQTTGMVDYAGQLLASVRQFRLAT